jgi:tryptophan-rich sensory protein
VKRWFYLLFWITLCFSAGAVGAQFTPGVWYAGLAKPAWTPPGWVFAPVWTTLYLLMAVAAWLVTLHGQWRQRRLPLALFSLQLAVNAAWSWLFFGLQRPDWALVNIIVLWGLVTMTVVLFLKTRRGAGILLLPYWGWLTLATALNAEIWRING